MKISRIGMVSLACAVAVVVFILALVLSSLGKTVEETRDVNRKLETSAPISPDIISDLSEKIDTIKVQPDVRVTLLPYPTVLQGPAGEAGTDGKDGIDGKDGKAVVVRPVATARPSKSTSPAVAARPSQSPSPSPSPEKCLLNGLARIGTIC